MNAILAILNIFIDPAASVRYQRAQGKLAWLPPLVVAALVSASLLFVLRPMMEQATYNDLLDQMSAEKATEAMTFIKGSFTFSAVMSPVMLAVTIAVSGAILLGFGTIAGVRAVFTELFTLLAHAALVPMLAQVAQAVVVKMRGELTSMKGMQPAFGLDLWLPEGAPRLLNGLLNYFSMFTIWYIVVVALGYAALTGISKGRAFAVTSPVWILGLLFALVGSLLR